MPASLLVEAEVVLDRDGGDRHVLGLDLDALLGLDGLVQALRPAAPFHDPARELVDDLDLAVDHEILDAVVVERLGAQGLDQVVDHLARARGVEVLDAERLLGLGHALLGRGCGLALLVDLVVLAEREALDDLRERVIGVRGLLGLARDDQRRARLVDEDRVDLVHDRERMRPLDGVVDLDREVVAQVVEAELGVRAVGDVAGVGRLARLGLHLRLDHADRHARAPRRSGASTRRRGGPGSR